jgi:hypothetical protein
LFIDLSTRSGIAPCKALFHCRFFQRRKPALSHSKHDRIDGSF